MNRGVRILYFYYTLKNYWIANYIFRRFTRHAKLKIACALRFCDSFCINLHHVFTLNNLIGYFRRIQRIYSFPGHLTSNSVAFSQKNPLISSGQLFYSGFQLPANRFLLRRRIILRNFWFRFFCFWFFCFWFFYLRLFWLRFLCFRFFWFCAFLCNDYFLRGNIHPLFYLHILMK